MLKSEHITRPTPETILPPDLAARIGPLPLTVDLCQGCRIPFSV